MPTTNTGTLVLLVLVGFVVYLSATGKLDAVWKAIQGK